MFQVTDAAAQRRFSARSVSIAPVVIRSPVMKLSSPVRIVETVQPGFHVCGAHTYTYTYTYTYE